MEWVVFELAKYRSIIARQHEERYDRVTKNNLTGLGALEFLPPKNSSDNCDRIYTYRISKNDVVAFRELISEMFLDIVSEKEI